MFFFLIEAIYLEIKLKLYTSFIVKEVIALSSLAIRQWLYAFIGIIHYADSHGSELSQEKLIGSGICSDFIKQLKGLIKKECKKGQNSMLIKTVILITKLFATNFWNKYE